MGWRSKAKKAKKLHRPSLKGNWERDDLHEDFPSYLSQIKQNPQTTTHGTYDKTCIYCNTNDTFPSTVHFDNVTPQEFITLYERKRIPCIIKGVTTSCKHGNEPWKANDYWKLDNLEERLYNYKFKVGEDDDGKSIRMKLKYFLQYLHKNKDDSPLYIFDSNFDEDKQANCLMKHYCVPPYFPQDLFSLVGEQRRPPYRWFLIGPERSGTSLHIDPLGSSAWNTLIHGQKRWILFSPNTPKSLIKARYYVKKGEDDEPIHYFTKLLQRIKDKCKHKHFHCYEFTQYEGDTVFIPQGWWHAVLNLTHTVAITQNYISEYNFDEAWVSTRSGRKKMAAKWLWRLERDGRYDHLVKRARELDEKDGFVLKYDWKDVLDGRKRKNGDFRKEKYKLRKRRK